MSEVRRNSEALDLMEPLWNPSVQRSCVVCGKPAAGKAICTDERCAEELRNG